MEVLVRKQMALPLLDRLKDEVAVIIDSSGADIPGRAFELENCVLKFFYWTLFYKRC